MIKVARWSQYNFYDRAKTSGKGQFLGISYSHFVEFARWSLKLGGQQVPFEEHGYAPGQHILPVLNFRMNGPSKVIGSTSATSDLNGNIITTSKSNSPNPISDYSDNSDNLVSKKLSREEIKKRSTAVPCLVLPNGKVYADSWSIANNASGLDPMPPTTTCTSTSTIIDLHTLYDQRLGPDTRQYVYKYLLKPSNANIWNAMLTDSSFGYFWKFLWWLGGTKITNLLIETFKSNDTIALAACKSRLLLTLNDIAVTRLQHRTTKYINGDYMTVEDVALCALVAPICLPPLYCEGKYKRYFDAAEAQDSSFHEELEEFRATEVGRYCLQCYAEHRM